MSVYRLLISCPDAPGLVAVVSSFILKYNGNIKEAHHHLDEQNQHFFMRIEIESDSLSCSLDEFELAFAQMAGEYQMAWRVSDSAQKKRILIMGSNSSHCVADLLHRHHENELEGEIVGVLSNHNKLANLASWYEVNFKQVEVRSESKAADIVKMNQAIDEFEPDVVVLARYMQIVPEALCQKYQNRIINIHHSFLPSFVGANPYARAAERGVKLIGATCHYVTANLDEGPIIEQDVVRVDHADTAEDMKKMGQDVEKITLAKGLKYHLEDRVLTCNNKTVVFS